MISPAVSALADAALLLPASILLLLYLAVLREWRLALALAASFAGAAVATILLKLIFNACGPGLANAEVVSPSGHVSFSTVFYAGLAILLSVGRGRVVQFAAGIAAALLLVAIGISRVRLGAHSIPEVLIGFTVGALAVGFFIWLSIREGLPHLPLAPVAGGFALTLVMLGGSQFSLERDIALYARSVAASLDVCALPPGYQPWDASGQAATRAVEGA